MNEQDQQPDEVRLLEWANVLLGHRWLIAALTILGGAIAYGLCKTAKPLYTAEAKLIANRDAETWSLMSLFGAKPGRGAGELLDRFSATYFSNYYMELLRSDPVLRPIALRKWSNGKTLAEMFEVKEKPGAGIERQVLGLLRKRVLEIIQDKATGMLSVRCTTPDPQVSAELANTLVERLRAFVAETRTSGTSRLLRAAEERTSQAQLALNRAEIATRDFRMHNRTLNSPDLQLKLSQLEREVKLQEELFIRLKTQVELLRLSEQNQADLIITVQPAEPPLVKSWPPTRAAVLGTALFGFLLGVGIAFVRHGIRRLAESDAPGYDEFARHIRSLNRLLPGLILLLPAERRREKPKATGSPAATAGSLREEAKGVETQ